MYRCKHARQKAVRKHTKSKILLSLLSVVLVGCLSISGTMAWVMYQTNPVVNTFTYGDIHITLAETGVAADDHDRENHYSMAPAAQGSFAIAKDPTITVKAGSEHCYLFATLDKSDNFDEYLQYDIADGWTRLSWQQTTTGSAVYYRSVDYRDTDQTYPVLKDNTVYVKTSVTKEMLNILDDTTYPTLTVNAYAVQQEGITDATEAWDLIDME